LAVGNNKQAFALAFVQRLEFLAAYQKGLTASQLVNQLDTNAGTLLSTAEKEELVAMLGSTPAPTVADALLDRLLSTAHRLELKGESMRKREKTLTANASKQ
jgi:hypothetical protein